MVACKFTILAVHIHDRSSKVRILNQCDLSVYESRTAFNVTWRETKIEVVCVLFPKVHIRAEGWMPSEFVTRAGFQPKVSSVQ